MKRTASPRSARPDASIGIAVELRAEPYGAAIGLEPVRRSDLGDAARELWWRAFVRRGLLHVDPLELEVQLEVLLQDGDPTHQDGVRHLEGAQLCVLGADGRQVAVTCPRESFQAAAERGASRLLAAGTLSAGQSYYFTLALMPGEDAEARRFGLRPASAAAIVSRRRDLATVALPLDEMLARSSEVVPSGADDHELFYTDVALKRAEAVARSGQELDPAVETGGVLLGWLGSCPEQGEAFVVVTDALAAEGADQGAFRLSFESATWHGLQGAVRDRRSQPGGEALRIVGQAHGHPFSPGEACSDCPKSPSCPRHSAFLSADDRCWSRAVFCNQPWQVGHLFGSDACDRPVARVFGQSGGWLAPRGYRLITADDLSLLRARS